MRAMNKLSASGVEGSKLRVSIFKMNNLQKGYSRHVRMMEFHWSKFLQLKPRNAVNVFEFTFTVHSQTEKYVEMISTSLVTSWNMLQFSFAAHDFLYLHTHSLLCKKTRKSSRRNRSMLNQSKEVLSFQESRV